ncbi:peroxiredoxin [Candidatus Microgenomates bacterium]|nr:peroxiredoxin [Candidatus Microgenomates bacterium]
MVAPDFTLFDQNNVIHSLSDYKGKWLIVYFYPKDQTPGCIKEACSFRDQISEFTKRNIAVVGISKDSVASHQKFADKYHLPFPLLSDEKADVIKAYGAWGRNTYVINPQREIVKTYKGVNPLTHVSQILKDLRLKLIPL